LSEQFETLKEMSQKQLEQLENKNIEQEELKNFIEELQMKNSKLENELGKQIFLYIQNYEIYSC
jgi:hypothetical protein